MSNLALHGYEGFDTRAFMPRGRIGSMTLHKGGGAPPPDPRIGAAADSQAQLAREQYADYKANYSPVVKQQMEQGIRISDEQNQRAAEMQRYQMGRAKVYDDRWDNVQVPLEDQIIAKARAYNEPAEQERMAMEAGADVNSAYARSGDMMNRDLGRRGISMNSGMSMALANENAVSRSAMEAGAINKTRQAARDIGWTRLGESAALGRGLPGFGAGSAGLSSAAGRDALSAGTAGVGLAAGASQANNAGYGAGGALYGSEVAGLNQSYANQTSATQVANANNPTNSILGVAARGVAAYYTGGLSEGAYAASR